MAKLLKKPLKIGNKEANNEKKTEKEKIEERKEEVLARGRKFKYPMQFAKYKIVLTTVIISVVGVSAMAVLGWAMLYKWQDTGDVIYGISRFLPVSVAKIDGEGVRFSDYLLIYRSSIQAVEQQSGNLGSSEEDESVRMEYKRAALTEAEELTYAYKLAKENGITVSKEEIEEVFDDHRKVGGVERNKETFLKVVKSNFGMSETEYKRMIELLLYKKKVQEVIDVDANEIADSVEKLLSENGNDLAKAAEELGETVQYEATGGLVDSKNVDGGRSTVATGMEEGEVKKFVSSNGDGYYFLKLIGKESGKVNYESIKIEFTEFEKDFGEKQGSVDEYIELEV